MTPVLAALVLLAVAAGASRIGYALAVRDKARAYDAARSDASHETYYGVLPHLCPRCATRIVSIARNDQPVIRFEYGKCDKRPGRRRSWRRKQRA